MADKYLLEDGSGGYLLEDGSGVLLLDELPPMIAHPGLQSLNAGVLFYEAGLQALSGGYIAATGSSVFTVDAVRMDNMDWIYSATNWADSPTGSLFLWQKITPSLGISMTIIGFDGSSGMFDFIGSDLSIFPYIYDSTESNYVYGVSAPSAYAEDTWLPVFLDWKTDESAGNKILQLYIGDSAISISPTDDGTSSFTVPWSGRSLVIGNGAIVASSQPFDGDMAEFWLSTTRLDFSVEANRRKFYSATGKPVDVGTDGSTPTGSAPEVYLSIRPGDAASDFVTNRGTGNNFTQNGTLTLASTSPSD